MTQSNLLNNIIKSKNITKDELSVIINTPKRKLNNLFLEKSELSENQKSLLNSFMGMSANSCLSASDGIVYTTEYADVFEENKFNKKMRQNYLDNYLLSFKNKNKVFNILVKIALILCLILNIISISIFLSCSPLTHLTPFLLAFFAPLVIFYSFFSEIVKFTYKTNLSNFKQINSYYFYIVLSFVAFLIFSASFNFINPLNTLIATPAVILFLINLILKPNSKESIIKKQKLHKAIAILLLLTIIIFSIISTPLDDSFRGNLTNIVFNYNIFTYCIALLSLNNLDKYKSSVLYASRFFDYIIEKPSLKKNYKIKVVLATVLNIVLITCLLNLVPVASLKIMYNNLENNSKSTVFKNKINYYDKDNLVFANKDNFKSFRAGNISFEAPTDFDLKENNSDVIDSYIFTSKNKNLTIVAAETSTELQQSFDSYIVNPENPMDFLNDEITITDEDIKLLKESKKAVIEKYGFYPKTTIDIKKLQFTVQEKGIDFFNKKATTGILPFLVFNKILDAPADEKFYREYNNMQFFIENINKKSENNSPEETVYSVTFNKKDDKNKIFHFAISCHDKEIIKKETIYKIINSIKLN